jgi:sarcosine oxidase subunit beta
MSDDSLQFYRRIDALLEPQTDLVFRDCGYLFLAHSEAARQDLQRSVALQHRFSIPSSMVSPEELGDILPALRTDGVVAASYCAEDGYFDDPWDVMMAFARAARRLGAHIEQAEVTTVRPDGDGWRLQCVDGRDILAEGVILAAGSDSVPLARTLGIELPIRSEPRYLFFSNPVAERICDPLVVSNERQFAVKQLSDGQFLTSYLGAGRGGAEETPEAWKAQIAGAAAELLPPLLDLSLTHLVKGYYDMTPDHHPIVGPVPGADGVWVAAGLSGHGFMMAPAIGRVVADLVGGDEPAWYARELGLERFTSHDLISESRVI